MPLTRIDIRTRYTPAQEASILEAVQKALVDVLCIPPDDRDLSLCVHEPHRMLVPGKLAWPAQRTVVHIALFPGRSTDAKRRLYQAIVRELGNCAAQIPPDHVLIALREEPFEHWGIRGGQAACDVDLGFSTRVD
jgi:phenylpyruvate tautomerase PptA (4-oxalocrotonate tautomerase family)